MVTGRNLPVSLGGSLSRSGSFALNIHLAVCHEKRSQNTFPGPSGGGGFVMSIVVINNER